MTAGGHWKGGITRCPSMRRASTRGAPPPTRRAGPSFDHVIAIAVRHPTDPWPIFADVLGGRYLDRGSTPVSAGRSSRFANGFVLEGLNPSRATGTTFRTGSSTATGPDPTT